MAKRTRRVLGEPSRATYLIGSRIAGYALFGVALNVGLLALLGAELGYLAAGGSSVAQTREVASSSLWLSLQYRLGLVGVAGLFGFAFPLAYLLLGKAQGLRAAVNALAARRTEALIGHMSMRLLRWARRRSDWQTRLERGGLQQAIEQLGPTYFEQLPGVPAGMRALVRMLGKRIKRVSLAESVLEAIRQTPGDEQTSEQRLTDAARRSSVMLREAIEAQISPPNLLWPAMLVGLNLAAFFALKLTI